VLSAANQDLIRAHVEALRLIAGILRENRDGKQLKLEARTLDGRAWITAPPVRPQGGQRNSERARWFCQHARQT